MYQQDQQARGPSLFPIDVLLGGQLLPLVEAPLEELAERLSRAAARRDLLAGLAAFGLERHVERTLHRSEELELRLCCWLPSQASSAHDHGAARGASSVVFGELVEVRYRAQGRLAVPEDEAPVARLGTMIHRPGAIHRVENRSRRPAVSLHAFLPSAAARAWETRRS